MSDASHQHSAERLSPDARARLLAEDADFLGKPFNVVGNPRAIHAHTRHIALLMGDTSQPGRIRRAAAFTVGLLDTLLDDNVRDLRQAGAIACGRGCAHCCTTAVTTTIPEVLLLAEAIRGNDVRAARIAGETKQSAALPDHVTHTRRVPCAVLEDNACSAYIARPSACRGLLSTSLATCVDIFEHRSARPMTHAADTATVRTVVDIMMKAALRVHGLDAAHMNLSGALAVALATPEIEARWLAGEPLFAAVARDDAEQNQHLKTLVDGLADAIRPTI
jgi:hypothetical protein